MRLGASELPRAKTLTQSKDSSDSANPGRKPVELPLWLERWVWLSENAITIPGTQYRIGLDALLGWVAPGIGDWIASLGALATIWVAANHQVPSRVLARMLVNVVLDTAFGAIPLAGDLFDVFFRSNARNLALLRRHAAPRKVGAKAWPKLAIALVLIVAIAVVLFWLVVLGLGAVLIWALGRSWHGAGP